MPSSMRDPGSYDPRTGEPVYAADDTTPEQLAAVVGRAATAAPLVAATPPAERRAWLHRLAQALESNQEELATLAQRETALGETRLAGEVVRAANQLRFYGDVAAEGSYLGVTVDEATSATPRLVRANRPLGPVAVFGASNFPLAFGVAGGDTASALAAGCPVVAKGHPSHPGTSRLIAEALHRAGLTDGLFTIVQGAALELGEALVDAPEIEAVGFTGSLGGGRALYDRATRREKPIPVYAEMGAVNPVVVTERALSGSAAAIAEGLQVAVTGATGQLCTKPGLVFVPEGERAEALIADVTQRLQATGAQPMLNERLRDALATRLEPVGTQAEVLVAGGPGEQGFSFSPAAYRTTAAELRAEPELAEECFGPVAIFVTYGGSDDLREALDGLGGQLAASIHCADDEAAGLAAMLAPKVGRLVFGGFSTGVAVCHAMQHGGPYPATTAPATTSVGMTAIRRFQRPVAWQDAPAAALPPPLRDGNPLGIWRRVNGELTRG